MLNLKFYEDHGGHYYHCYFSPPSTLEAEASNHCICDTGVQNPLLVVFGFLISHILRCICFKILFKESKYLFSN